MSRDDALVAYFGYGSLVNRATHRTDIVDAMPARLLGWRRSWCPRPDSADPSAALLTVSRAQGSGCDGLLVVDRLSNLDAVDRREARYRRVLLDPAELECSRALPACDIHVYEVFPPAPSPTPSPVILRSYLDAVMQGFWAEHGEAGVSRFVQETDGFDLSIHEDRAAPLYPRSVVPEGLQMAAFEAALESARPGSSAGIRGPVQLSSSKVTMETSPSSAP